MKKPLIAIAALLLSSCAGSYPTPESGFTQMYEESLGKAFSRFEDFDYSFWKLYSEDYKSDYICYYNGERNKWLPFVDYGIKDTFRLLELFLSEASESEFQSSGGKDNIAEITDGITAGFFRPLGWEGSAKYEDRYVVVAKSRDTGKTVWSICYEKDCVAIAFGQGENDDHSYSYVNTYYRNGESAAYQRIIPFYENAYPVKWLGVIA